MATRDERVTPADRQARERIETDFETNLLVEAGAGSGKTHSLARRMAGGIAAGTYRVEQMAAVTFTRKAAAELRGRFQEALEERHRASGSHDERERLDYALRNIERVFTGTIHAFCAHLLRERPVEARMAPGFIELDELEDVRHRKQAWREFVVRQRSIGAPLWLELQAAGVRQADLDDAFGIVCGNEDVEFPPGDGRRPDVDAAWSALEAFWAELAPLVPESIDEETTCRALQIASGFDQRLAFARRWRSTPATVAELIADWDRAKVVQKWWSDCGKRVKAIVERFQRDVTGPFVAEWRRYVYSLAVRVLTESRSFYALERRRQNLVNYVDLLLVTARLLRENRQVREALQKKYRWFLIDEFQDTDPIQAEIFLLLGAEASSGAAADMALDPWNVPLRPGALFVVGDPKQSIYRFRRADIDIYNRVRNRIVACGGEVLRLTANWRSVSAICDVANRAFASMFPASATRESPAFEPLDPMRADDASGGGPRIARLVVPATVTERSDAVLWEAQRIAEYIRTEVTEGRRKYGSFLVLTRNKPRLKHYVAALEALNVPVEVSGAGRFGGSLEVEALAGLLQALADPLDAPGIVGVLRGPLFGTSDADLFAYVRAGGRFDVSAPLVGNDAATLDAHARDNGAARSPADLRSRYGPALEAILHLRAWLRLVRHFPAAAAVDRILDESGWLALACSDSPGGARAADLLQAVDCVRAVFESGGGLAEAAEALEDDADATSEVEALPLEPGRLDVVRLMNLHKTKGLEAEVVFLADPASAWMFSADVRIVRGPAGSTGYLQIVRKREGQFNGQTLGEPSGWEAHCAEEERYRAAEVHRLLYVAATRARDRLIVGQWAKTTSKGQSLNEAWGRLDRWIAQAPELQILRPAEATAASHVEMSNRARRDAAESRRARHAAARLATFAVRSVTGDHPAVSLHASRVRELRDDEELLRSSEVHDATAPAVAETATEHADAGVAWGSLIHGLLEHTMRSPEASASDLARLAAWLIVEHPRLRPLVPQAVATVERVRATALWAEARASAACQMEVPFAILVPPDAPASVPRTGPAAPSRARTQSPAAPGQVQPSLFDVLEGGSPDEAESGEADRMPAGDRGVPTVLRGVIDLVYRDTTGWRIIDYKTDRILVDVAELAARYGDQLRQYRAAWTQVTGASVTAAHLFHVRSLETVPVNPSEE